MVYDMTNCGHDYGVIKWTTLKLLILEQNWEKLTTAQLAKALQISRTMVRKEMYARGLKKIEMEYFKDEQTQFLLDNYQTMGDTELAEIFEKRWPKNKAWTYKHIRKKRVYLHLKRTEEQLIAIEQRNLDQGRLNHSSQKKGRSNFLSTGPSTEGEIRMYLNTAGVTEARVRVGKCWLRWPRWAYQKYIGPVPKGHVVIFKDNNPYNTIPENLEAVTRAEATRRISAQVSINLTDNYIAGHLTYGNRELRSVVKENKDLIEVERSRLLLKRKLKSIKNERRKTA